MKYFILFALLALSFAEYEYDGDVMVLTDKNIKDAIQEFEYIMVEFYAPWCGHCKEFAPHYAEAATEMKAEGIVLAKIDAHEYHQTTGSEYGIKSYPTIKYFVKGEVRPYEGARSKEAVKNFIYSNLNPESEFLESLEKANEYIIENEIAFIYFAQETTDKDRELRKYKEFSFTMKQHFAHTQSDSIREALNIPQGNYFVGFRKGERHYYEGKLSFAVMRTFVENVANDRILEYQEKQKQIDERLFQSTKPVVLVFSDYDEVLKVAKQYPYQEDIVFVHNVSEEVTKKLLIRPEDQKTTFIIKGDQKYWKLANQSIGDFLAAFKDNRASKYLKSQDAPTQTGPIKILVGSTYETIFNGDETIILYYDSNNEEHIQVLNDFARIQKRLNPNKSLRWAQIDLAQNEVSDLNETINVVRIRLYNGSDYKKFIMRANKLQEERFVKWIIDNSQHKIIDTKSEL